MTPRLTPMLSAAGRTALGLVTAWANDDPDAAHELVVDHPGDLTTVLAFMTDLVVTVLRDLADHQGVDIDTAIQHYALTYTEHFT